MPKTQRKRRAALGGHGPMPEGQKMSAAATGAPPEWFSTHPASGTRIRDIEGNIPKVEGLYERAPKPSRRFDPPPKKEE